MLPLITVIPYVLLAVLAGYTIAAKYGSAGSLLIDLALCALAAQLDRTLSDQQVNAIVAFLKTLTGIFHGAPVVAASP